MKRRASPSHHSRGMSKSPLPPTPPRMSSTRLYSIAMLFSLTLLQFVPQFSIVGSLRKQSQGEKQEVPAEAKKKIVSQDSTHILSGTDDKVAFNYTAFWDDAMEAAQKSLRSERVASSSSPCPKVYVYDLPSNLIDTPSEKHQHGFGKEVALKGEDKKTFKGLLYQTDQYAFPSILEERLRQSNLCRTTNPHKADLFYAPVLPAPKTGKLWKATCSAITADMIRNALPYLNETNACHHFFAVGKGHYNAEPCEGWYYKPIPEFRPFLRLAYTNYVFDVNDKGAHDYLKDDVTQNLYPNLFSVPYPSSLHFRSSKKEMAHFQNMNKRTVLMSFFGKDTHGDVEVRQEIHKSCDKYRSKRICEYNERFKPDLVTAKGKATFCLEPAGDSPWRKSISDSITFGCIPVLFSELTDNVTPWFWDKWKARGRILVPRDDFVAGRMDLKKLLQSIPSDLLTLMQATLKEKARQFQYSIDDDQEDGIRITLDNLHREALDMERLGVCGY